MIRSYYTEVLYNCIIYKIVLKILLSLIDPMESIAHHIKMYVSNFSSVPFAVINAAAAAGPALKELK